MINCRFQIKSVAKKIGKKGENCAGEFLILG